MDDDERHEDFDFEDEDPEREIERAWHEETGSNDPQGPPVGWRPSSRQES